MVNDVGQRLNFDEHTERRLINGDVRVAERVLLPELLGPERRMVTERSQNGLERRGVGDLSLDLLPALQKGRPVEGL